MSILHNFYSDVPKGFSKNTQPLTATVACFSAEGEGFGESSTDPGFTEGGCKERERKIFR